jgi:hypothetical protein
LRHFASRFKLFAAFFSDHLTDPGKAVGRCKASNLAVQSDRVVVVQVLLIAFPDFLLSLRRNWPDTFQFLCRGSQELLALFISRATSPVVFSVSSVYFSEAIESIVVVASSKSNPFEPVFARQFGTLGLILHVVDNLVSDIVGLQSFIGSVV